MIEKIKYHLLKVLTSRQMRIGCIAVITALSVALATLISYSIYTVNIFDGEKLYTVRTLSRNVTSVLSGINFRSNNYNIKETTMKGNTASIKIAYTYPVYITCGENTVELTFEGGTVEDALKKAGFSVDGYDFVEPALNTVINDTVYIDYTNIDYVDGTYTEAIPYTTDVVYSNNYAKGTTTLKVGTNGVMQVGYTEKFVNGVSVEKTVTDTEILTPAVNGQQIVGTKDVVKPVSSSASVKTISVLTPDFPIELDANGNPVNYKSKMTVRATAYTYTGNNCSTGVAPKPGYIAVNPKVIPYGTKMYIKSPDGRIIYGYAVAADTGGFIRKYPTGIDLFMSTETACRNFGVRNMEIYIIG
ncbi:MAG: DUF348 domain-containing protein [Ruminococcaceae bacterium]|nr:DUF348 domain-containing protein [Oscillospiraceae bacterium]